MAGFGTLIVNIDGTQYSSDLNFPTQGSIGCRINGNSLQRNQDVLTSWVTVWTYSGAGTFEGLATTSGGAVVYADGDTFTLPLDTVNYFYTVAPTPVINPLDATDLTNTTWYLKQHVNVPSSSAYYITFSGGSYDCIIFGGTTIEYGDTSQQSGDLVYQSIDPPYGWGSNNSRPLTITGGSDVTNSTLIAWFKANCVSPLEYFTCTDELTDLADAIRTKTEGSSSLTYPSGYVTAINGISVKHVTSYSVPFSGPNDVYIEIGDIPVGSWDGFSSINVEIEPTIYDGSVTIYTPPQPFEFTIANVTYTADDGMTWAEWVASSYNTGNFELLNFGTNYKIVSNNGGMTAVCHRMSYPVYSTEIVGTGVGGQGTQTAYVLELY